MACTLHEFAREEWGVSDEDYQFWSTRSVADLNRIYNDEMLRHPTPESFYMTSMIYPKGNIFKENHAFRAAKDQVDPPWRPGEINSVLDYGCGAGKKCLGYAFAGKILTLADLNTPMYQMVSRYYLHHGLDLEYMPLYGGPPPKEARWDLVVCLAALHHTRDPVSTLESLASKSNKYLAWNLDFNPDAKLHLVNVDPEVARDRLRELGWRPVDGAPRWLREVWERC